MGEQLGSVMELTENKSIARQCAMEVSIGCDGMQPLADLCALGLFSLISGSAGYEANHLQRNVLLNTGISNDKSTLGSTCQLPPCLLRPCEIEQTS